MSAWLCSQDHINLIVNASPTPDETTFKMLLEENLRSLRARYGEKEIDENEGKSAADYAFEKVNPAELIRRVYAEKQDSAKYYAAVTHEVTPDRIAAQIRKACDSYSYQSCEHDEWDTSAACALVKAIVAAYSEHEKLEAQALWSF